VIWVYFFFILIFGFLKKRPKPYITHLFHVINTQK